jgi:F0F1-type ATP synthase membrane subunit a
LKYVNVLGGLITPVFHLYFDGVGAVVQAYVFMLLTMMY